MDTPRERRVTLSKCLHNSSDIIPSCTLCAMDAHCPKDSLPWLDKVVRTPNHTRLRNLLCHFRKWQEIWTELCFILHFNYLLLTQHCYPDLFTGFKPMIFVGLVIFPNSGECLSGLKTSQSCPEDFGADPGIQEWRSSQELGSSVRYP